MVKLGAAQEDAKGKMQSTGTNLFADGGSLKQRMALAQQPIDKVRIPGGEADLDYLKKSTNEPDPYELAMGIAVEMEHTNDRKKSREIALDHLKETPDYYTRLYGSGLADEKVSPEELGLVEERLGMIGEPEWGFNPEALEKAGVMAKGGGIHIDKDKKGTFTAAATKHGESVQGFASKVLANKDNYSSAMVKKANFARNAAKWHDLGGYLQQEYSLDTVLEPNNFLSFADGGSLRDKFLSGLNSFYKDQGKEGQRKAGQKQAAQNLINLLNNTQNIPITSNDEFREATDNFRTPNNLNNIINNNYMMDILGWDGNTPQRDINPQNVQAVQDSVRQAGNSVPKTQSVPQDFRMSADPLNAPTGYGIDVNNPEIGLFDRASINAIPSSEQVSKEQTFGADSNSIQGILPYARYASPLINTGLGLEALFSSPEQLSASGYNISPQTIGNYATYNPIDREYLANQVRAQAGATQRNIINTSGGNRGVAQAGLLASGYNAQRALNDAYMQTDEANLNRLNRAQEFNRQTDMFNAQATQNADAFNIQNRFNIDQINMQNNASRRNAIRGSFTAAANDIGDIGQEAYNRNTVQSLPFAYQTDLLGNISYKKAKGGSLKRKRGR